MKRFVVVLALLLQIAPSIIAQPVDSEAPVQLSQQQQLLSHLPAEMRELIIDLAQQPKDPNMEAELQHILYWMGGQQRCYVKRGDKMISVLGMMVMIEKTYQNFKPVLPNIESLFMLASRPRVSEHADNGQAPPAMAILFFCRKQAPVPIMQWLMPEVERYRREQKNN